MTMPIAPGTRVVQLPDPGPITLGMLCTDNLTPSGETNEELQRNAAMAVLWVITRAHPLSPDLKIKRMFSNDDGVEVYSASDDGTSCMRDFIPMSRIRFARETMSIDLFVQELEDAESEDEEPEPEPEPEPEIPSSPGQVPS